MNTGHLTVAWLPGGGYSVVDSEHNTIGRYSSREIAAAHHALALEEVARLRAVVRQLRDEMGGQEALTAGMLAGFTWTREQDSDWWKKWNAETERLVNGGVVKDFLTTETNNG